MKTRLYKKIFSIFLLVIILFTTLKLYPPTLFEQFQRNQIIVDSFIFYNELDMLEFRLTELNDVVDYFVIVEATHTFTGNKKELYYLKNKHRFNKFNDKIIHIVVDDMPNTQNAWDNEKHQRNCIKRGLSKLSLRDDDIIIISDSDEIPNKDTLSKMKTNGIKSIHSLEMSMYYYNLTTINTKKWHWAKICPFKTLYEDEINDVRLMGAPIIKNGGWHFSYFGNSDFIKNKIRNFSHQEFNNKTIVNDIHIQKKLTEGKDLYNRTDEQWEKVSIDPKYLPQNYKMLLIFT